MRGKSTNTINFLIAAVIPVSMLLLGSVAKGQQTLEAQADPAAVASSTSMKETNKPASTKTPPVPVSAEFMGVRLGMSAEDVREKLGNPKDKGNTQDIFVFSDSKSAQVYYDKQGNVMALSIDFIGYDSEAPQPEAVLGEAIQAKPDGSMYALKRYPEAGYWVAYSRTAGKDPITTVTIQKM
jgi:hypothetical protein